MNYQDRVADAGVAVSTLSFCGVTLSDWSLIANIILAIVGIVAGISSHLYYRKKARMLDAYKEGDAQASPDNS